MCYNSPCAGANTVWRFAFALCLQVWSLMGERIVLQPFPGLQQPVELQVLDPVEFVDGAWGVCTPMHGS
jgi:hypothetical protein